MRLEELQKRYDELLVDRNLLSDEVARLEGDLHDAEHVNEELQNQLEICEENKSENDSKARILELHYDVMGPSRFGTEGAFTLYCAQCSVPRPCPTVEVLAL